MRFSQQVPLLRETFLPAAAALAEPLCFPEQIWILLTPGKSIHSKTLNDATLQQSSYNLGTKLLANLLYTFAKKEKKIFQYVTFWDGSVRCVPGDPPPPNCLHILIESTHPV